MTLEFPRPASDFLETIPHRPPFVWIDEVLRVSSEGGVCAVMLREGAHYFGPDGLRRSSYLEFMAQGFAYVRAAQSAVGFLPGKPAPKKAFLVSIQDAVYGEEAILFPTIGSRLTLEIGAIREVGPITLFTAIIHDESRKECVRARLKVFSE